jgi:chromosome segregation ATPase
MVKELYAAASEHTARTENLSKENKELQDRVIKLEEEKKQLLLDCDALNAEIYSLNAAASEHTARTENLSNENKELQDRVIKLEEEKKHLLLNCDALNARIKSLEAIALPQPQVENMD